MSDLDKMRDVLQKSYGILCNNLDPTEFLRGLFTKGAITFEQKQLIESKPTHSKQIEQLLDILMHSEVTSYAAFMLMLKKLRGKIYEEVKKIERFHSFNPYEEYEEEITTQMNKLCSVSTNQAVPLPAPVLTPDHKFGDSLKTVLKEKVRAIGVCRTNGNIVLVDNHAKSAFLYNQQSLQKLLFPGRRERPKWDTAVTQDNYILVTDGSPNLNVFKPNGQFWKYISTLSETENPDTKVDTKGVAVSSRGDILVSDVKRNLITIHRLDGLYKGSFKLNITPIFMAMTNEDNVLISDGLNYYRKVLCVDMSGNKVFHIDTWKVDGVNCANPEGLACDNLGQIYIGVRAAHKNTGHIHVYSDKGVYIECIAKGLRLPRGLAWSNEGLYIADFEDVKILQ